MQIHNAVIELFGFKAMLLFEDPSAYDRWVWLKRHLQPGPLRTLDAGCGSGLFVMYASSIGNEAVGISFDERINQKARDRSRLLHLSSARFIEADLRGLDQLADQLGKFDQILCLETIEHILDDRKLIAALSNLLRPGGQLLLTTPYNNYRPLIGDGLSQTEDGGHVKWGYSHQEVREMFGACGLDVAKEEFVSGFVSQQLINSERLMARASPRLARALLLPLRMLQILDAPLTKLFGYPYLSISVIGLKRDGASA